MFESIKSYFALRREEKAKQELLDKQAACVHPDVDRRLVLGGITNPGKQEVICISCGLTKVFDKE